MISRKHVKSMRSYLRRLDLHPEGIATRKRHVAFVDLVSSGDTFSKLITLIHNWAGDVGYDWHAVSRRIRLIGVTKRTKTSPKTWRWQQHATKLPPGTRRSVKNVSVPWELWHYLGDYQEKVVHSYTPSRWGDPALTSPSYEESQLRALRLAYELFELGRLRERRRAFASLLVQQPAMKLGWLERWHGKFV